MKTTDNNLPNKSELSDKLSSYEAAKKHRPSQEEVADKDKFVTEESIQKDKLSQEKAVKKDRQLPAATTETDQLSDDEFKQLYALYFEGMLTREEEKAFEAILASRSAEDEHNELSDEAVFVMGIERATAQSGKGNVKTRVGSAQNNRKAGHKISHGPILWQAFLRIAVASAAAALIIGCVSAIWRFTFSGDNSLDSTVYIVYQNGVKIDDPAEAKRLALITYNERMALMEEMQRMEAETIEKMEARKAESDRIISHASELMAK